MEPELFLLFPTPLVKFKLNRHKEHKETYKDKFDKLIDKADRLQDNEKDKYVCDYFKKNVKIVKPKYEKDKYIVFEDDWLKWIGYEGDDNFPYIDLVNETIEEWYNSDEDMGSFIIALGEDGYKFEY